MMVQMRSTVTGQIAGTISDALMAAVCTHLLSVITKSNAVMLATKQTATYTTTRAHWIHSLADLDDVFLIYIGAPERRWPNIIISEIIAS